jgi:ribosomal-protein-alanine N-acetyltransferase
MRHFLTGRRRIVMLAGMTFLRYPSALTKEIEHLMAEQSLVLRTARLDLVVTTAQHLRVELETPERLGELLGAEVPAGWPPGLYDRDAMEFFLEQAMKGGEAATGWYGWYAIRRATDADAAVLVASAGYLGPPSQNGTVEIGYSVAPEARRQGYATEIVDALVARALGMPGVQRVVAEAHDSNEGSVKALLRCGFLCVGQGREEGHSRFERCKQMVEEPHVICVK